MSTFLDSLDQFRLDQIEKNQILFYVGVDEEWFIESPTTKLSTLDNPASMEESWPSVGLNGGALGSRVELWSGTEYEREIWLRRNQLSVVSLDYDSNMHPTEKVTRISTLDYERYKHLEILRIRMYPELNERINLCSLRQENFDPIRDLLFHRELPPDCRPYIELYSHFANKEEYGY